MPVYTDRNPMPLETMLRNLQAARLTGDGWITYTLLERTQAPREILGNARNGYFSMEETTEQSLRRTMMSGCRGPAAGRTFTLKVTTRRGWDWCYTDLVAHCIAIEAAKVPATAV